MSTISDIAGVAISMKRAELQSEIAVRLLQVARRTGAPEKLLEAVRQAAAGAAESGAGAVAEAAGLLDVQA